MASAREIALGILDKFEERVIARGVSTYGMYAAIAGKDPTKAAMVVGPAMHAIGAACVFVCVPVAPLYYVKRADGFWRGVFEEDPLESRDVLPHYDLLYVTAREYRYSAEEFGRIRKALAEVVPNDWSPHIMWHVAISTKPKGFEMTYFERALRRYQELFDAMRAERRK